MFLALAIGFLPLQQTQTVELYRGAQLRDGGYFGSVDTYLDSTDANRAKGGLFTLEAGKGKVLLLRFDELERVIPPGSKIVDATLFLSPSSPGKPEFAEISALKAPWGEGPMFAASMGRTGESPSVRYAATWKQRRGEVADWQEPGATGPEDSSPIAGATLQVLDKKIAIHGLAAAVQTMADRWFDNHGFAIVFEGRSEFFSSQARAGKPRLKIEFSPPAAVSGPDLSLQWLSRSGSGDDAAYRATVKNVGDASSAPFEAQWIVNERPGGRFAVNKGLAPGEETVIEFKKGYRPATGDRRARTLGIRLFPASPEPNSRNDALTISEDAVAIAFEGAKPDPDSLQRIARRINDVLFPQSRFSFATDGVLDRVRFVPDQASADFVVNLAGGPDERGVMQRVVSALTGLNSTGMSEVEVEGKKIPIADPFPGLNGFGDTRYEGLIPAGIPMLYVPVASPLFDNLPIEPTDMLSGTEVAAINASIGRKGADRIGILWDLPATVIFRATDMTGRPLDGAELAFYQLDGGKLPEAPTQTILTKEGGTVILENRDPGIGNGSAETLHRLNKNPFGTLRSDGSNGIFLIRAQVNGETEWGWLKAWQLVDAYHRGNRAAAIIDVRFNTPSGPVDRTLNLAKGRLLSDSASSLPARLAALVDEDLATTAVLGPNAGDWFEIDLGRDRPIGEVVIVPKEGAMPVKFDIQAYATGQTAPTTDAWVKDLNFKWTLPNRVRADGSIPYRGPMTRARFLRIVNRSGGAGTISEVKVFPLRSE